MGRMFANQAKEDGLMIFVGKPGAEWTADHCVCLWRNGKITMKNRTIPFRQAQDLQPAYPEDYADLQRFLRTGTWDETAAHGRR